MQRILKIIEQNTTRVYLTITAGLLVIFSIWFTNIGLLPFKNSNDFLVFLVLIMVLALYRPSWTFAFFVASVVLENIAIAPAHWFIALRPYQLFAVVTAGALVVQRLNRRIQFALPKWKLIDVSPIVFALGSLLSASVSSYKGSSLKQTAVALSCVGIYYLVRIFIQSLKDLKKIVPFFLMSSFVITIWGIVQNVRFMRGLNAFEVMPGRPNATLPESDWYGLVLVFFAAMIFSIIAYVIRKKSAQVVQLWALYAFLIMVITALILTVSRSAWLGFGLVVVSFIVLLVLNYSLKPSNWAWKRGAAHAGIVLGAIIGALILVQLFSLSRFQLLNRATSSGGNQLITISCEKESEVSVPKNISSIDELSQYHCKHINLEDIASEKGMGNSILEVYRPDPNVNIRSIIYKKSIDTIRHHFIAGIGWGAIAPLLGSDDRGNGLNSSNIFLEVWLGSGIIGLLAFLAMLGYVGVQSIRLFFENDPEVGTMFVLLGLIAIIIPNMFNAGIFLALLWVYLAVAVSLIQQYAHRN